MLGVPPKSSGGATNRCVMSRLTKMSGAGARRPARLTSAPHQHVDHDPATARVNDQSSSCRGPARFPLGVAAARSIHPSRQSGASSILARYIWELSDASNEIYSRRSARRESANLVIGAITIKGIRPTVALALTAAKRLFIERANLKNGECNQRSANRMLCGGVCDILIARADLLFCHASPCVVRVRLSRAGLMGQFTH